MITDLPIEQNWKRRNNK